MKNIGFKEVVLNDGFWKDRYTLNENVSIDSVYERFEETGRFDALRFKKDNNKPLHVFYDSDIAKWIEAVSYVIMKNADKYKKYVMVIDNLVEYMDNNRLKSGYLNSFFIQKDMDGIFKRRLDHELYCAGHLIEAAIAYYDATGKKRFLDIMCDYADHIEQVFVKEKSAAFTCPGHAEIELALVKLYHATKEKRYLKLAEHFILSYGQKGSNSDYDFVLSNYAQNNATLYNLEKAEGHAVRAVYLYKGMADYALETNDKKLFAACKRLFNDIMTKMYITGGIGSARIGESFTVSYDLPNLTAYSESCAAIGLMMFCRSMFALEQKAQYHDVIERALYNGFLSSTSLDGKSFFYENPLEVCLKEVGKETSIKPAYQTKLPPHIRSEVFECSCCPPNINRTVASIADYIFASDNNTLYINQFISSKYNGVKIETDYPVSGKVKISGKDSDIKTLKVRKPFWCENFKVTSGGENIKYQLNDGYITLDAKSGFEIEINFDMPIVFVRANKKVRDNAGKVAVQRGPVVYAAEGVDNGSDLFSLSIDTKIAPEIVFNTPYKIPDLIFSGHRDDDFTELYVTLNQFKTSPTKIRLIPYYTFSNRGESDMLIWLRTK